MSDDDDNAAGNGNANGNGAGRLTSFIGPGFGTLVALHDGERQPTPPVLSSRAQMRRELPIVYQEDDLAMRFVGSFEHVLDPIVALLDNLAEHFRADFAPRPVLDLLAAWLGQEIDEDQDLEARREAVRTAGELARRRGTVSGMEMTLRLSFPGVPMRIEDEGGVRWSRDAVAEPAPSPRFVVYVDVPLPEERVAAIARCIEREKPVEASYRLRVKADRGARS